MLAPADKEAMPYIADAAVAQAAPSSSSAAQTPMRPIAAKNTGSALSHTVRRGESAWTIARRYGMRPQQLLTRNGLASSAILQPGMVLLLDGKQTDR